MHGTARAAGHGATVRGVGYDVDEPVDKRARTAQLSATFCRGRPNARDAPSLRTAEVATSPAEKRARATASTDRSHPRYRDGRCDAARFSTRTMEHGVNTTRCDATCATWAAAETPALSIMTKLVTLVSGVEHEHAQVAAGVLSCPVERTLS